MFLNIIFIGRLSGKASVCTTEMYAVRTALTIFLSSEENGNSTVFFDFQNNRLSLKFCVRVSPIAKEIDIIIYCT